MVSALLPGSLRELWQSPAGLGPAVGWRCQPGPGRAVSPMTGRTNQAQPSWEGWKTNPCVHPSASVPLWDWTGPAGGRRTRPGMAAELLGSCRIDALPSPPSSFPPGLRLPSLPFSLPSRSKQNGCSMAILFPVWKGEAGTPGLGSFLEAAAMSEPNSPVSTWHRL